MTDTTSTPAQADAIAPVLKPASVPVPSSLNATAPAADPKAAPATPPAAAETPKEDPSNKDAPEDQKDDPKRKAAHRIGELYAQKKAAERDAMEKGRRVQELERRLQEYQKPIADPTDFGAQQRADTMAAVTQARAEDLRQEAISDARRAEELRSMAFNAKIEAARERIPDIDQALNDFAKLPVTPYAADVIGESEKAAEISYFLAKNPAEAYRIAGLPPHMQGVELARIEARVSVAQPRKTSNAPPPPPMIGASTAPSTPALRDMGVEDIGALIYGKR